MKIFKSHLKSVKLSRKTTLASCLTIFAVALIITLWHNKTSHPCDTKALKNGIPPLETTWNTELNCCAITIPGKGWLANDEIKCLSD